MEGPLVVADCTVDGRRLDVRLGEGWIAAVGPGLARDGDEVLDAGGGVLLPGLHDHHLHLLALAAARASVDLSVAATPDETDALLRTATDRVVGYDEHRHGPLDRARLDRVAPGTRVQHRSGLGWVRSTAAGGVGDGWTYRSDDRQPGSLGSMGAEFASFGITAVTDTTATLDATALRMLRDMGLPQRVTLLGVDDPGDVAGWACVGPRKLLADEVRGLDLGALTDAVAAAHAGGRPVAIHCVTRAECVAAVAALDAAGPLPGDRLEHATVLPAELDPSVRATVVVQPGWIHDRGDHYLDAVDPDDLPYLHRARSLLDAGIRVMAGSDAPFGPLDPWLAMTAATTRRSRTGQAVGPDEAVDPATALGWYTDGRRVAVGEPADLCLLDGDGRPAVTIIAGRIVWAR